jgi:hypothetical protein
MTTWRILCLLARVASCVLGISLSITPGLAAGDSEEAWAALVGGGHVALIRHGNAPPGYGGDPPGLVDRILSSPWCRCLETARLMAVGRIEESWALVPDRDPSAPVRLLELKKIVSAWRGPGTLVLVTHALTVRALLGFLPIQGETVVLRPGTGTGGAVSANLVGLIAAPQ